MDGAGRSRTVSSCSGSSRRVTRARDRFCDAYDLRHHFALWPSGPRLLGVALMKMPGIDQTVIGRRAAIAKQLRQIVGREWVLDSEAERRPYECDGLTAYSASPLLVVLPETTEQVKFILQFCNDEHLKVVPRG